MEPDFFQPADRVRIKICGITSAADAAAAIDAGADALGLNFFPGSKRFIEMDREIGWIAALPRRIARIAVLVNMPLLDALQVAAHPEIDAVQFHGDEDAAYCREFAASGRRFIKAMRLRDAGVIAQANEYSTCMILLDADAGTAYGGTGTLIDLDLAAEFTRRQPGLRVLLAGGLRPENVGAALKKVGPFGVDVASGVEETPRRKSAERMREFCRAAALITHN